MSAGCLTRYRPKTGAEGISFILQISWLGWLSKEWIKWSFWNINKWQDRFQ